MNFRIIFLCQILTSLCIVSAFSQNALKEIVLTYDLNRKVKHHESNRYDIDKAQLVHIEPICKSQDKYGTFCAVILEMNNRKGKRGGKVSLIYGEGMEACYFLESEPTITPCTDNTCSSEYLLEIKLSEKIGYTCRKLGKIPDSFSGRLKGKRMDVKVSGGALGCPKELKNSEPWVCKFVFN